MTALTKPDFRSRDVEASHILDSFCAELLSLLVSFSGRICSRVLS